MKFFYFTLLLSFVGCCHPKLEVINDYITIKSLASYHVETPDPLICCPPLGQRLMVHWRLGKEFYQYSQVVLDFKIRFKNREVHNFTYPVECQSGYTCYDVIRKDYFTTRGILTYDIKLMGDGEVLDEWRHVLWQELIHFDIEE